MFKKTIAALAVAGAFGTMAAGAVYAADVTLYGVVDLGLKYSHVDADQSGVDAVDKLEMKSGSQSGSRFGIKGAEDVGNGLKVGFQLENGFDADTGSLGYNSRLFGREARLYLSGDFGEVAFGRMGTLGSGNGTYGLLGGMTPFGTSWGGSVENGTYFVGNARADNTVTYKTPTFAGFTAYAQYSFDMNTKQDTPLGQTEGKAAANRYYALGANYKVGSLDVTAVVDSYNWSNKIDTYGGTSRDLDDALTVTLGGSYDFGVAKAYLSGQYFDNMLANDATDAAGQKDTMDTYASFGSYFNGKAFKGYSVLAGMDAPVLGGKALFAVGYTDAKDADGSDTLGKTELSRYGASVGYTYDLSRRTNVYAVAAYYKDSVDKDAASSYQDHDPSTATIYAGIRHTF